MRVANNNHHVAHSSRNWNAYLEGGAIRENNSMIARGIGYTAHQLLHRMTAPVPVPGYHTLVYVANRLPSGLDVVSGIDAYSSLVEQAVRHPRCKPVERQLGLLSIEAMREQIPYIEDGLPNKTRIIA